MNENRLGDIPIYYFSNFHELERLSLGYNKISRLTLNETRGLFSLRQLTMESNHIPSIACNTFGDSPMLTSLNLRSNQLTALPCIMSSPEPMDLKNLNLANNRLTDGHNSSVALLLRNVTTLDVSGNKLKELTNFITEMPSIKLLWLNGNKNLRFDPSDFLNSPDLLWVKYDASDLTSPPLLGKAKSSMTYIDLGKNKINCIDIDHVSNMTEMKLLNFTENDLERFPNIGCYTNTSTNTSSIQDITFPKLMEIILTSNKIYEFPFLPGMPFKSIIRLQYNSLVEFPPERMALLIKVGILQMEYNNANEFPDFSQLPSSNMTDLDLSHNSISSIPNRHIAPLVCLVHLRLQYNFIPELPDMSFASEALQYLHIHHNLITELDPMILSSGLQWSLTHLYASYNLLTQVSGTLLSQCHVLRHLDISYNVLQIMPCVSGVGPELQTLLLQHNNITHVPAECMTGLSGLQRLDLSYNFIANFPFFEMATGYFPSLTKFDISNNLISFVANLESLMILESLHINIRSNAINCTKELCWLKIFKRFTLERDEKLCASPPKFVGIDFNYISEIELACYCEYPKRFKDQI